MYTAYWNLTRRPFDGEASDEYYPSESQQGALLKLRYAIDRGAAAALLVAPPGTGKSLVWRMLAERLTNENFVARRLRFPLLPVDELLGAIACELCGADSRAERAAPLAYQSVARIGEALAEYHRQGQRVALAIDEAHLIDRAAAWEALRLLLNFDQASEQPLTIVLVGQLPLLATLARMPSWEERLAVKCLVRPFTPDETASYVAHRLTAAGAERSIFLPDAFDALHEFSEGIARRINRLADLALLLGYAEEHDAIGASHIATVAEELLVE